MHQLFEKLNKKEKKFNNSCNKESIVLQSWIDLEKAKLLLRELLITIL